MFVTDRRIRPANILLSIENVPVLVDFGFAERYDLTSSDAFHSNLSYGTPEVLYPTHSSNSCAHTVVFIVPLA